MYTTRTRLAGVAVALALAAGGGAYAGMGSAHQALPRPQVSTVRVSATEDSAPFAVVSCPASHPYLLGGGGWVIGNPIWWDAPYSSNPYWHYSGPNAGNAWMIGAYGWNPDEPVSAYAICES